MPAVGEVGDVLGAPSGCLYAAYYCEENVWQMCRRLQDRLGVVELLQRATRCADMTAAWAVFISNPGRSVPLWCQKAARVPGAAVVWDYHVILLTSTTAGTLVWDLDTTLPFPSAFPDYCRATLGGEEELEERFHRRFRSVPAATYLATLASDRRHMRGEEGWQAEPPSWPCIRPGEEEEEHNLDTFIDTLGEGRGEVHTLQSFMLRFNSL